MYVTHGDLKWMSHCRPESHRTPRRMIMSYNISDSALTLGSLSAQKRFMVFLPRIVSEQLPNWVARGEQVRKGRTGVGRCQMVNRRPSTSRRRVLDQQHTK